ncbi:MAG: ATP-binding protein [Planctomycetota bacterium]|nr:MAG: ATP-binding protein [Planctomycetota bacterium]
MAITNHDRVGKALESLATGLKPFVQRELENQLGDGWENAAKDLLRGSSANVNWDDPKLLLDVLCDKWNAVFRKVLGAAERTLAFELRDVRNKWAHRESFTGRDTLRYLDSASRLLTAVSAAEEAEAVDRLYSDLQRTQFEEQRRSQMRKKSFQPTEGKPQGGLQPWREVVTPHPDVASGKYQQAEFAADLWQVYQKEGSDEYKHPTEFFRRTFLTVGLSQLLKGTLLRLAGRGGDPVVELQTNFGGGKTHSMLALYHLFSGAPAADLPGVEDLLQETGVEIPKPVRRAVIVGTKISPGKPHTKPDGTVVRTLWGEIAWQLGGTEAYEMVREDDENGTNPGDTLKELFNAYAPCLILVDEWVAYARQLHEGSDLPAGTFDTQFTFAQTLSESVKAADRAALVVSVPASDNEIGGEWGQQALSRLKNAIGRVESSWRPASSDEGFEIVRRRLFQPLSNEQAVARDAVARSFVDLYGAQHQEFPSECREAEYERRMKMAYPIHPELFDRLYNDWSTLDKFQRTRGVLRLMASVIHALWERQDSNLLITPATVPMDDPRVQFELTRYMEDQWSPVIDSDVDGPHSLPLELDRENPNLGRYSACRRVARTIYMGSAPVQQAANRGIDERRVKLGCVQPGESVATFGDALRRLTDKAMYLYVDGNRYWYSTQPTVSRLAEDRAAQLHEHDVIDEVVKRLRREASYRGNFSKVHACVSSGDVPDDREARLVILGPEHPHTKNQDDSAGRREAQAILDMRGSSPRNYRNSLVFLAADATRLRELLHAARQYLAWSSIWDEREQLNLDNFQSKQAETKRRNADETVKARIPETYQWLLVPSQPDPKAQPEWIEMRQQGQETLANRASKKLTNEELLLTQLGGTRLRLELDRVPLWRGDHVGVKQLMDDFATYLYLPRLQSSDVLIAAVRDGLSRLTWKSDSFAYAEGWDEKAKRYVGLQSGTSVRVIADGQSLLVNPGAASTQMDKETAAAATRNSDGSAGAEEAGTTLTETPTGDPSPAGGSGDGEPTSMKPVYRRFHGSVQLDPLRAGRDASRIADEVIQHLSKLVGADVEVTLEIQARLSEGASEKTVRDVTENCRTLRFDTFGFEEA